MHKDENTWTRRFQILDELEKNAIQHFLKLCGQILLAYLLVTSLRVENLLKVQIQTFEVSIPVTYFLTASSFIFLIATLSFCHLSVAMSLKIKESAKMLLPGFSTNIYGLLRGKKDDISLGISEYCNYFFKEKVPISSILSFAILFGIFAALIPLMAFGSFIFWEQLQLLFDNEVAIIERVSVFLGCFLVTLSFVYVILFHVPLPTCKNTAQIRRNFLSYLSNGRHPRADFWSGEE